ncbi:mitochondrial thiamine pyrophosphate carrier 1 [Piromyces finnis]|uniref:Mitochondrial thiamine pyrophosphate carrier 1 n=1 Tax=Piromyces finnis TaxID=1754191 RepID=A0A1Y1VLX6_9FUNG|nr:mitochondrial thiamine pyrophosphate carrier 1 [Piromyces finnis]|eukprot:ORX59936.1 mitochondrial thiamine pyrophosphate carrier 1 [Piromyces finnis]
MSNELSNLQNTLSGAVTGFLSGVLTAPLDVLKIRMQLQKSTNGGVLKYNHILKSIIRICREEGIKALWKGNIAAQYLSISYGAVQFYIYEQSMKGFNKLRDEKKYPIPYGVQNFVSGAISGANAVIATYPFDFLRTRFATQGNIHLYRNIPQATYLVIKNEGIKSLYKGVVPSVVSIIPYIGTSFQTHSVALDYINRFTDKYPKTKKYLNDGTKNFISGGVAGILSKCVTMPLDNMRKVMQVNGEIAKRYKDVYAIEIQENNSTKFFSCMKNMYHTEGIKGFYKGIKPSLIKSTYGTALTFFLLGECHSACRWYNKQKKLKEE